MEWTCPFCKGNKKAADLEPAANQSRIRGRNFRGVTKIRHIFAVADFFRPGGHRGEHLPGLTSIRTKTSMGGRSVPAFGFGGGCQRAGPMRRWAPACCAVDAPCLSKLQYTAKSFPGQ